ncbi:E3 ubiquitin-protein ligase RNF181 isoform X3 [Mus pahari]|uniref:E3 ubiquitin-protein ligase RNF181 isoform X3 n=1 Tax=Mus pahari TaxID=10093 RepID=UPI000A308CFC|nr:E3 ubiquitin-protein ligase RNF181 isoform X3 [Mus pahari]
MASYFDEHDCEPLNPEREARNNMLLELARRVRGAWSWAPGGRSLLNRMDFEDLGLVDWEHHLPPPAAKAVVESLPRTVISSAKADLKCPVCLLEFEEEETVIEMPCHHLFHSNCILPWLRREQGWEAGKDWNTALDFSRQIPALCAAMSCPLMMTAMKSTRKTRLAGSNSSTAWRTSTEPCTREAAARAERSAAATPSRCTLDH